MQEVFLILNAGFNDYSYRRELVKTREEAKSLIIYNIAFNSKYVCFCWTKEEAETMVKNLSGIF